MQESIGEVSDPETPVLTVNTEQTATHQERANVP